MDSPPIISLNGDAVFYNDIITTTPKDISLSLGPDKTLRYTMARAYAKTTLPSTAMGILDMSEKIVSLTEPHMTQTVKNKIRAEAIHIAKASDARRRLRAKLEARKAGK